MSRKPDRSYGQRVCPTCTATFEAHRVNQVYCGINCRPTGPRANATQRGYGYAHQALRRRWVRRFKDGERIECHAIVCLMPSRTIGKHEPWDLGHTLDRTGWTGPEHRRCNRTEPQLRDQEVERVIGPKRWVV